MVLNERRRHMKDKDLAEILETEVSEETKKEFTGNRGEDDEQ